MTIPCERQLNILIGYDRGDDNHCSESIWRGPSVTIPICRGRSSMNGPKESGFVVYYESMKRNLKIKPIYECRCNERLQTTRFITESRPFLFIMNRLNLWSSLICGQHFFFFRIKKNQNSLLVLSIVCPA